MHPRQHPPRARALCALALAALAAAPRANAEAYVAPTLRLALGVRAGGVVRAELDFRAGARVFLGPAGPLEASFVLIPELGGSFPQASPALDGAFVGGLGLGFATARASFIATWTPSLVVASGGAGVRNALRLELFAGVLGVELAHEYRPAPPAERDGLIVSLTFDPLAIPALIGLSQP